MSQKTGAKQNIDLVGDPSINIMLAVLAQAKKDGERRFGRCNLMWGLFKKEVLQERLNIEPAEVADWVMVFIQKYGIRDECLSVREWEMKMEENRRRNKAIMETRRD